MRYIPLSKPGEIFRTRASCADAVVNILVKGNTEEEVEHNLRRVYDWFDEQTRWEPLE